MTLQDYKDKHNLTYDDLENMTNRRRSELHRWISAGATVEVQDRKLVSIDSRPKPPKRLWVAK